MQLQEVSIGYSSQRGSNVVARSITSTLALGQLTALIGPNGVGKSTLIRTMAGFQPPLKGALLLNGSPLHNYDAITLAKQIGIVLTTQIEVSEMSVFDLVAMGRSPYTNFFGKLHEEDCFKVNDALRLVGIFDLRERKVNTLSDGERQKVMIAKVLAQETPIILLDEPTAFLDFPSKVETMLLLKHLAHEQQKAILVSTHDVEIALHTTDALWILNAQHSFFCGTPQELAEKGTLYQVFSTHNIHFNSETLRFNIEDYNL